MTNRLAALVIALTIASCGGAPSGGQADGAQPSPDGESGGMVDARGDRPDAAIGGAPDAATGGFSTIAPIWRRDFVDIQDTTAGTTAASPDRVVVPILRGIYPMVPLPPVTVGAGEPGEVTLTDPIQAAVLWLDAADGTITTSRLLGARPDPDPFLPGGVMPRAIEADGAGGVVLTSELIGDMRIHPGTAAEQQMSALVRDLGDERLSAHDPIVTRYDATATPGWIDRGVTPGPLTDTWFNYIQGAAALADGSTIVIGQCDGAGFTFAGHALSTAARSYFARLDASGAVTWLYETSALGRPVGVHWLGAAATGEIYGAGRVNGATLFATSPTPFPTRYNPPDETAIFYRVAPAGGVTWARTLNALGRYLIVLDVKPAADGDLSAVVWFSDGFDVLDETGAAIAHHTGPTDAGAVIQFRPDGSVRYVTTIPAPLAVGAIAEGSAHTVVAVDAVPGVEVDGLGPVATVPIAGDHRVLIVLELADDGTIIRGASVAVDIEEADLTTVAAGGIAAVMDRYDTRPVAFGDGAGGWTWVAACPLMSCTTIAAWSLGPVVD